MTTLTFQEAERQAREALAANQLERAESLTRAMLASGSGPLPIWSLLVTALRRQGRAAEARPIQEMLVNAAPGNLELRFDLAEILLLLGEFDRGWREYHHRYGLAHTVHLHRKVQMPAWDGRPLTGQTLLIHDEQGFGDSFQFMRLVSLAKQRSGARIVLQIIPEQAAFARRLAGVDQVILRGEVPPPFDAHCQMMSLPRALGLKLSDLPGRMPYLEVDPARVRKWQKRLAKLPRPLVALVWAGQPSHFNDANRSTTLAALAPLGLEGVSFLSVQKGPKAVEAASPPSALSLVDLAGEIKDFDDTAAIFKIVDLLISVDSSPVHLAGGVGCPAWVMLPFVPDWRWLLEREDSPWYPSLRLFRQRKEGDWVEMIERMAGELARLRDQVRAR